MLVNCVVYEQGKKLADISISQISDYLERPGCFIWVALRDATADELSQMQIEFGLHDLAVEDAQHGHQRPKIEEYGETLFAVMHLVENRNGDLVTGEVDVFVGRNFVLSVRNRSERDFIGVRERCEREPHLLQHGSGFVFYALMDSVVDRYFPIIDELECELESIEEQIFNAGAALANIKHLYKLKNKVTVLRHAVTPLLEAAGKLASGRAPQVCANSQEYFRDVYDHLARVNTSIDAIRDTIGTAIQVNLSMTSVEQTEINKRLAAWAGIFGVATALAGIWGMNFESMPELKWDFGYPVALLTIAISCTILYFRFKKTGWL